MMISYRLSFYFLPICMTFAIAMLAAGYLFRFFFTRPDTAISTRTSIAGSEAIQIERRGFEISASRPRMLLRFFGPVAVRSQL